MGDRGKPLNCDLLSLQLLYSATISKKMGLGGFVIALLLTTLLTFGATAEELAFKPSDFPDEETCSEGKSCWHGGDSTKHCFRRGYCTGSRIHLEPQCCFNP